MRRQALVVAVAVVVVFARDPRHVGRRRVRAQLHARRARSLGLPCKQKQKVARTQRGVGGVDDHNIISTYGSSSARVTSPAGGVATVNTDQSVCVCSTLGRPLGSRRPMRSFRVVELGEAVELTVGVVDGRLVDAAEGRQGLVGAVEERLQDLSTLVKVSGASHMQLLRRWTDFILQVCGKTRVQEGRLRGLTHTLTQQPGDISNESVHRLLLIAAGDMNLHDSFVVLKD
ncbi:hypothetical protein EYF80_015538 [Liparis tanakae]|uniref:Secreted protein n=1 Tax=Liparis tanakae TaxID=230148 RepID=A0A4Z2IA68_9TELE|nr:hypothetical protein EYF80_015538 [Liparis tanakae]